MIAHIGEVYILFQQKSRLFSIISMSRNIMRGLETVVIIMNHNKVKSFFLNYKKGIRKHHQLFVILFITYITNIAGEQ